MQAAAKHWQSGDKALANLRLVFAGLPALDEAADTYRLRAAAYCLDHGLAPRELMAALDLDPAVLDLRKFDPDQPRVPAGHGRESGQWTDGGAGGAASAAPASLKANRPPAPKADRPPARRSPVPPSGAIPHIVQVAADGPLKPGGIQVVPRFGSDPLDPKGLNTPLSFKEQQTIADTVNMIVAARPEDIPTLNPHEYKNRPDFGTGAVLPDSVGGYTTYYVRSPGGKAGEARIVMDKYFRIYYSNNHYKSFYPVDVRATPNK